MTKDDDTTPTRTPTCHDCARYVSPRQCLEYGETHFFLECAACPKFAPRFRKWEWQHEVSLH